MKTCPMCGASVAPLDIKCAGCGESLAGADQPDDAYSDGTTEQELRAFVGRRADYYLGRWRVALRGGKGTGFNFVAFLFSSFWLPYRKMYRVTCIYYGATLAISFVVGFVAAVVSENGDPPASLDRILGIAAGAVVGACGNGWYLAHARRKIAALKADGLPEQEVLLKLPRLGGTSVLAGLGGVVLYLAVVIGILAASEMTFPGQ
jgi:hypothetical protein